MRSPLSVPTGNTTAGRESLQAVHKQSCFLQLWAGDWAPPKAQGKCSIQIYDVYRWTTSYVAQKAGKWEGKRYGLLETGTTGLCLTSVSELQPLGSLSWLFWRTAAHSELLWVELALPSTRGQTWRENWRNGWWGQRLHEWGATDSAEAGFFHVL